MAYTKRPPAAVTNRIVLSLDPDTFDRLHARTPQPTKASLERTAYRLLQWALDHAPPPEGQKPATPTEESSGYDLSTLPTFRR